MHHKGNLTITTGNAHLYTELTSVGGSLYVQAKFSAPALTSVGGYLDVRAEFSAPALTSVGSLYVQAKFSAPVLSNIGGLLDVQAEFSAPVLSNIEGEQSGFKYLLGLKYPVLSTDKFIRIGCQRHERPKWASFTDRQIQAMDVGALEFWREHKEAILAL